MKMRYIMGCFMALLFSVPAVAQQYTGMSGLIHVPSADMGEEGEARVGGHFLNREFTPNVLTYGEDKYHTMDYYLSVTPFRWMEIAYTCTLLKSTRIIDGVEDKEHSGLHRKDRYFSLKLQPLREKPGRWWPSVAIGVNDLDLRVNWLKTQHEEKVSRVVNSYFSNYYIALSKHFRLKGNVVGVHMAYRHWRWSLNSKWNGPVGGITFSPSFQRNFRLIAEYTGDEVNVGFDWKLWRHLLIQSSLQDGKYFSGGVCFCINLL
ncbi:YjbH domain-containing protein [uncultured Phocaeicola sp.]|uniref:YjbH domain-containing protein n=2 Tax=uncultured Phocaeicola sp. TaxID=990718 RepID=UPI00258B4322|nr:YjbH domain-containing protein [uncultured Phocaeicola sp.]